MNRAIRYHAKLVKKYACFCPCGCNFVGYSNRAMKAFARNRSGRNPKRKGKAVQFKTRSPE